MKKITSALAFAAVAALYTPVAIAASPADAAVLGPIVIPMNLVDASGGAKPIGTITATDTGYGLLLTPNLTGLPPGLHGFHVHENPSCDAAEKDGQMTPAQAAGGHLDPAGTKRHEGPYGTGHLGDLPPIYVSPEGKADNQVLAPRLKVADLTGRSIMIHAGGDNCSDHPAPLGGGGARIACGVTPAAAKP